VQQKTNRRGSSAVRVKRWGKSPPAFRVTGRLANPVRSKIKQKRDTQV